MNSKHYTCFVLTAWPQGQFIQQIPATAQPNMEGYSQQYPNGIYQTTYQQAPFDGNTFYTGAVQVLTNARPPSAPNHPQLAPRANGTYSHSSSPVSTQQQPPTQQNNVPQRQYHQEYQTNTQNYVAPATTPTSSMETSRPSSVNNTVSTSTNNPNFTQQNGPMYTSVASSPASNPGAPNYVISNVGNSNSGNDKPGYPQVNSNPQLASLNSSGCPGSTQYSGNNEHLQQQQTWEQVSQHRDNQLVWEHHAQNNKGLVQNDYEQQQQEQKNYENECINDTKDVIATPNQPTESHFSQADRVNLNTRLKTMILNKQQQMETKPDESQQSQTGHFLLYSHHHRLSSLGDGGGEHIFSEKIRDRFDNGTYAASQNKNAAKNNISPNTIPIYSAKERKLHSKGYDRNPKQFFRNGLVDLNHRNFEYLSLLGQNDLTKKSDSTDEDNLKTNMGSEIPPCSCFPPGSLPPEPGSYYTHLGNYQIRYIF